jgi:hypothetical protein
MLTTRQSLATESHAGHQCARRNPRASGLSADLAPSLLPQPEDPRAPGSARVRDWISAAGADDRIALPDEAIGGDAQPALEALVHDVGIEGVFALKRLVAVRHQHDIIFRYDRISVCSL